MRFAVLLLLFSCLSAPAVAQNWALRDHDVPLSAEELVELSQGATLTYHDDGRSKFSAGGAYSYTYADDGGTAFGRYEVMADGRVCIDFRNGFSRCDRYVRRNGAIVMLTEKGERFPVRSELGSMQ